MRSLEYRYSFPATAEPEWSGLVDRWYQLDAYAYGLCQAYWFWNKEKAFRMPGMIVLASSKASNETDQDFALSGAKSPAKFSHTLPSIRSSPLCRVMNWEGVVLCFQKDPETFEAASREAQAFAAISPSPVWVLGVEKENSESYRVRFREFLQESHVA